MTDDEKEKMVPWLQRFLVDEKKGCVSVGELVDECKRFSAESGIADDTAISFALAIMQTLRDGPHGSRGPL